MQPFFYYHLLVGRRPTIACLLSSDIAEAWLDAVFKQRQAQCKNAIRSRSQLQNSADDALGSNESMFHEGMTTANQCPSNLSQIYC
jgi:hypothetical protein